MKSRLPWFTLMLAALALPLTPAARRPAAAPAQARAAAPVDTRWADWVEPDFPFFSSVLDARRAGAGLPSDNLTPRAVVLNLGRGYWAAFDTDLLRVAAIWRGAGVTPRALAPGSYRHPDKKTPGGQFPAPEPDGTVWLANGIYPGWQAGTHPQFVDPREPAPSPEEVGRGPLTRDQGRFTALRQVRDGVVLEYTASGATIEDWLTVAADERPLAVERHVRVGPSKNPLAMILGVTSSAATLASCSGRSGAPSIQALPLVADTGVASGESTSTMKVWTLTIPPRESPIELCTVVSEAGVPARAVARSIPSDLPARRWPQEATTRITRSSSTDAYVVDDVGLPDDNPWRRYVRPGDIQFLKDGTGATATLDGDVWLAGGLQEPAGVVRWKRFASGLHEPLTLAIRDEQIYVFDRNGIWRLRDRNGDGEADVHEMFSNAFAQTADMREFPSTIRLAPGGEFVIAKGGQEATTIGKHNGSVLRISADGTRATVLGYGFRQPNISVNIKTGLVLSSDQQGHYIPTTPLHIVRDHQFYGFLSDKLPREKYPAPIAEPLTWIPHATNASATSQVWLFGAKMGPLTDGLVHIGFNNPELFRVLFNKRGSRLQAAVVSITRDIGVPILHGSVNPADGQLYLAGLQILGWGTTATRLTGLARVRYTGAPSTLPNEVAAMDKGVLLRFDEPVDPDKASNPANYSLTSWHYKRTYQYGSPQFKADGTPGIDRLAPSAAYVSKDRRSVFVAAPGMTPVMQMRIGWSLATAGGTALQNSAFFTPYELTKFDPKAEGFGDIRIDLSRREATVEAEAPVGVAEGQRLAQLYGCMACHATEANAPSRLGPTWNGLYGAPRPYAKGALRALADDAYLRESILQPAAKVVSGYERGEAGMPSYAGVLTDSQIESIILFIKTLR